MRILYWTPEFHPLIGGVAEQSRHILPHLQKRNYEFLVATFHHPGLTQRLPDLTDFNGIPVHRYKFWEGIGKWDPHRILMYQGQIAELKRSFKPDLVHLHDADPYAYLHMATACSHPAPTLVHLHSSIAHCATGPDTILGKLLTQASWVVGVSKASLAEVRRAVPTISNRSSWIYSGLGLPKLAPGPYNFHEPRILCLGRVVRDKGFDLAIAAFAHVRKRFPASRLIIAGDGLARTELERQAATHGLTGAVDFLGWVDPEDVPELINRATIVVMPSRCQDCFPLVALQAAQMARPVVAARVGGLPESVIHRKTGLLVDKEDAQQLAHAIEFLLEHPGLAVQYGHSARTQAEEVFSLTRCIDAYDSLYKKLARDEQIMERI